MSGCGDIRSIRLPPGTEVYEDGSGHKLVVHAPNESCLDGCVIHNPSDHPMRDFPTLWRSDRHLMERTCPHGVGHPDPDSIAFLAKTDGTKVAATELVHGCDGCCAGSYSRYKQIVDA